MALADAYYKIKIGLDEETSLYKLQLLEAQSGDDIISELVSEGSRVRSYNDIHYSALYEEKDYSIEYNTTDDVLKVLMFQIWPEADPYVGIIESSTVTQDCSLFKTDRNGLFEIYIFKNMKHKQDELFHMLVLGDLDNQLRYMLINSPF